MRTLVTTLIMAGLLGTLAACGNGNASGKAGAGGPTPTVVVETVRPFDFADRVQAVGTAYARESTTLTSTVTERVVSLNFRDGQLVNKGAVIATLAASEESADLAQAQARAREADQQLARLRELQQRGFATNANIDAQVGARNAAAAQAGAIRARIGDRVIRAPFTGVVGLRRISEGSVVSAGSPIATIADLSIIKLDFSVPETLLSSLSPGQQIEAKAAAYRDAVFHGTIDSVEPTIDPLTRAVMVRALLPNPDRRLRPGMLLTVAILSNPRRALAIPELALIAQRDQSYVFKVAPDGTATRVQVRVGMRQDGRVEILSGLRAGDRIVSEGTVKVRDGGKVKAAAAAARVDA